MQKLGYLFTACVTVTLALTLILVACSTEGPILGTYDGKTPEPPQVETPEQLLLPTPTHKPSPVPTTISTEEPELASCSLGDWRVRPTDGMVMVCVPPGEFQMGSTEDEVDDALAVCNEYLNIYEVYCDRAWFEDELPAHTVALNGFWIDQTEVTVAQFRAFVEATGYETAAEREGWAPVWESGMWGPVNGTSWQHPQGPGSGVRDDHPVVQISWNDAVAYCEWAGAQLPTEAEWEYAARGPQGYIYPWGNDFDGPWLNYADEEYLIESAIYMFPVTEYYNDGYALAAPVGSYPEGASWVGALDMAGNVGEWVADWYGGYPAERQENPTGPLAGEFRVVRGGSWELESYHTRAASRSTSIYPYDRNGAIGFRCVVSLNTVSAESPMFDEAQVRYILADSQLGGVIDYYRSFTNQLAVAEAVQRWDAGVRVTNIEDFERRVVEGSGWLVVYVGTNTQIDGMDVRLTTDP